MNEKNEIKNTINYIFKDCSMPTQQIELTEKEQCRYFAIFSIGCGIPSELVTIKMLEKKYGVVIHY
ncbi:MAG: hypothetical protein HYX60_01140 [Legionella longbeachae]|nr:hypothetical protein [Legionella longbeachae]